MNKALQEQRMALAAAFRWAHRENWHEAVANHFSLAVNDDGTQFLINPNMRHFSLITASELLLLDANDQSTLEQANAPDPTAWGLHGSIHRHCPHARCVLHVHSTYATVLASLEDMVMPPIDQNTAQFYQRTVVDQHYGGMAFEEEGERCAAMLSDPSKKVMVMGNHGVLVLGSSVADALDRLSYFERSAKNYILALQTGRPLKILSHEIAEKTAQQWQDDFSVAAEAHFNQIVTILDRDEPDFRH
ncbi:MAG: class II aldolase and adducin N-terminal domain-containing protein [Pseudomonadales bacterium]